MHAPLITHHGGSAKAAGRVTCVILNSNRREDTLECLASIHASTYPEVRCLLVDCLSTDGSVAAVREAFPAVDILELPQNRGYSGNNNVGLREAVERHRADWIFVLNEDTSLAPDCLERLLIAAGGDPTIGVLGPLVFHSDEPAVIESAGGGLSPAWRGYHVGQNETDLGQHVGTVDVAWICGCALLARREVFESIGYFDDRFFMYWEETEWCVRASTAGWRIVNVRDARLWHKGVQRDYKPKPSFTYYMTRNRLMFLAARGAPLSARLAAWFDTVRTLVSWSVKPRWRAMRRHRDAMWAGARDYLAGRTGPMPPAAAGER